MTTNTNPHRPTIRCAHCEGRHFTAAGVFDCAFPTFEEDGFASYERYLEDRGFDAHRADEQVEWMSLPPM
jgi:hypothetical protein